MEIIYKRDHGYSAEDVKELFLSVDWLSGQYPERLKKALDNCETVITAWTSGKLIGLINVVTIPPVAAQMMMKAVIFSFSVPINHKL